jgi:hypothetical protein
MSNQIIPPAVRTLSELEDRIRAAHADVIDAHTSVVSGLSTMIERAIEAGTDIIAVEDQKMVPHGQKILHYKRCNVGERQAQRYKKLAGLVAANPTCKSELTGLSIEAAIRKLSSSSKLRQAALPPVRSRQTGQPAPVKTTHTDIIHAWLHASAGERQRAVNSIGLKPLLAAMPKEWVPLIDIECRAPPTITSASSLDLLDRGNDVPTFLLRAPIDGGVQ